MASAGQQIVIDITTGFGSCLLGSWLSCVVWGASSLQVFIYFMCSGDHDPASLQFLIAFLWVFDTANTLLVVKGNWRPLVSNYGDMVGLALISPFEIGSRWQHHTWIESTVIFVVQLYFIRRIYKFAKKSFVRTVFQNVLTLVFIGFMVLLASWQLIGIIIYQVHGYGTDIATLSKPLLVGLNISLRAAAVAADVIIALCMLYLLTEQGPSHFARTRQMVYRLIFVTVGSGALTAVIVTLVLILLAVYPDTLYYTIVEFSLCSLYFSTLLINLNTRDYVQGTGSVVTTMSSLHASRSTGPSANDTLILSPLHTKRSGSRPDVDIHINTQTSTNLDGPDVFASSTYKSVSTSVRDKSVYHDSDFYFIVCVM
ncbi:hypothetical protein CPB85DRAFT_1568652 [Mucidula mucida]|nr:hypothetical protein CPB85DRAFT_1568652 [Mucidula mucida]